MEKGTFEEVRLGKVIGSAFGPEIYAKLSLSLDQHQIGCPNSPITPIPTAKDTVIHSLEFDVEKGQLFHRPKLMNDVIGIDEELLQPPEVSYLIDEYSDDISEVIQESSLDFQEFLKATFSTYGNCYIRSPTDYGELELETFKLDLDIKPDTDHLLPKHKHFPTNNHITKVVDKVCQFWMQINLAWPSEVTSHTSRLLVVTKKVSQRAFDTIKKDVENRTEYRFRSDNPSELYSVDPDILTVKQCNQIFRICLYSRDLNGITKDMVQRSQNPESTIYNLMLAIGGADASATKKFTWQQLRELKNTVASSKRHLLFAFLYIKSLKKLYHQTTMYIYKQLIST